MLKITVIGGGSTYTPELVNGFLERHGSLPVDELWLMDIQPERLAIVGEFAQRMAARLRQPFKIILSSDLREALCGAAYVITQLRVGQMHARREDEYLGQRHGLIGQETTGIGGMAKALRTIPVVLNIAKTMAEVAPGALLINFTNPAGLITEALSRFAPEVPAVGVCNVALTTKMTFLHELTVRTGEVTAPERAKLKTLGLNHLSWHYGFEVDGVDIWQTLFPVYLEHLQNQPEPDFEVEDIRRLGMIPNYYLRYFYYTARMLARQDNWPPSRAEEVMAIEADLLARYADPTLAVIPSELMKRGGAWYSTVAAQLINAHYNDLNEEHVVNVRNNGAIAGWPDDWVLEMPCWVSHSGIQPITAPPLADECYQLIKQVKQYEIFTSQAAVSGDRNLASQALVAHPLGPKKHADTVLDDLLRTNREFLPQFF